MIIYLLKSPFDSTYRNVVDFIHYEGQSTDFDHSSTLAQILLGELSAPITITANDRAIKRSVDLTSLTIKYNYDEIREYNYVIIRRDSTKYNFYFITNIISNNDSPDNPSCTLTLKWDVWNNNIDTISKSKSFNSTDVSHFDRFELDDNTLNPMYHKVNGINLPITNEEIPIANRYIPVFKVTQYSSFNENIVQTVFKYPLRVDPVIEGDTDLVSNAIIGDSVNGQYGRNVIYSLYGIYDIVNQEYVDAPTIAANYMPVKVERESDGLIYNTLAYQDNIPMGYRWNYPKTTPEETEYIFAQYLTFNCPFEYTYNSDTRVIQFPNNLFVKHNIEDLTELPKIVGDFNLEYDGAQIYSVTPNQFRVNVYVKQNSDIFFNNLGMSTILSNKALFRYGAEYNKFLDPIRYTEPFTYYSLIFANEEVKLTPSYEKDYLVRISKDLSTPQAQISISNSNLDKIYSHGNIFITESVPQSIGTIAETSYMIRNGSQHELSRDINKLMIGGYATKGLVDIIGSLYSPKFAEQLPSDVKGIASSIVNNMKYDAFERDLSNIPGNWYPSSGECDNRYQDRPRLYKNSVPSNNDRFNQYLDFVYYFGYEKTAFKDILSNTRITFDYIQTSNCDLCDLIINSDDRVQLERIFNAGVTKWHILYDYEDDSLTSFTLPTKDKNVTKNNIEHKFVTNPTYVDWLNT